MHWCVAVFCCIKDTNVCLAIGEGRMPYWQISVRPDAAPAGFFKAGQPAPAALFGEYRNGAREYEWAHGADMPKALHDSCKFHGDVNVVK